MVLPITWRSGGYLRRGVKSHEEFFYCAILGGFLRTMTKRFDYPSPADSRGQLI